jgi:hypothetical protein
VIDGRSRLLISNEVALPIVTLLLVLMFVRTTQERLTAEGCPPSLFSVRVYCHD